MYVCGEQKGKKDIHMIKIETGSDSIFFNLAAEEYYMSVLTEPFYMIWRTTPSLISGRYQDVYNEVNLSYARENGITVSRRKSGGGTVYADLGGVMYSKFYPKKKGSEVTFAECSDDIARAISSLGVKNVTYSGRNDLLADGYKICGNARMENEWGLLHHGSILFDVDFERMQNALMTDSGKMMSKGIKSVRSRVKNISELTDKKLTYEQFKHVLWSAVDGDTVINAQNDRKKILPEAEFLASWDFIYGVNPLFGFTAHQKFDGGRVCVSVDIKHSKIENISFSGDFFYNGDISFLTSALCGSKYDIDTVKKILDEKSGFHKIDNRELASLICGG